MATTTIDQVFLLEAERILAARGETLVEVCYAYAAGSRDFWLIQSSLALQERLGTLPARTLVNIYRRYDLSLRGSVDEALIQAAVKLLPTDAPYLIVYCQPAVYFSSYDCDISHAEMEEDLRDALGQQVACGPEPAWGESGSNMLSAVVPDADGSMQIGIY